MRVDCCWIFWPAFGCYTLQNLNIYDLQLFKGKNVFLDKFYYFFGNKTVDQRFGENLKNLFLAEICCKFLALLAFLHTKCWKWLFQPAFGVRSTQTLVEIYNRCPRHQDRNGQKKWHSFRKKAIHSILTWLNSTCDIQRKR